MKSESLKNVVTKDDIKNFATKDDIKNEIDSLKKFIEEAIKK